MDTKAFVSDISWTTNTWGGHPQKIDWCTLERRTEADAITPAVDDTLGLWAHFEERGGREFHIHGRGLAWKTR